MKYGVVILAAGSSTRMGNGKKKEYLPLPSKFFPKEKASTVLSCVAEAFLIDAKTNSENILTSLTFVFPENDENEKNIKEALFSNRNFSLLCDSLKVSVHFVRGGNTRQQSVYNALSFLRNSKLDLVAIHDGARPWCSPSLINRCIATAAEKGSCAPIIPVVDTIKVLDDTNSTIKTHLKRSCLGAIQTPQVFNLKDIIMSHEKALEESLKNNREFTDDSEIWSEFSGKQMFYCGGEISNKKITYQGDI